MVVLLGSHALKHHIPLDRIPRDIDILGSYDDCVKFIKNYGNPISIYPFQEGKKLVAKFKNGDIIECEIDWGHSSSHELYELVKNDKNTKIIPFNIIHMTNSGNEEVMIPSKDVLLLIKLSHRYLKSSPHFLKTMDDVHKLRNFGAVIQEDYKQLLKLREKETYNYSHPKLNQMKDTFFSGDGVEYQFSHDEIHEIVKNLDKPAYTYYSGGEVWSDMKKFKECSEEIKLFGVLEESLVLHLERSQIPFKGIISPRKSFEIALEKVCTSICSGEFRRYAWENYYKILEMYDESIVDKFWKAVDDGKIKRLGT